MVMGPRPADCGLHAIALQSLHYPVPKMRGMSRNPIPPAGNAFPWRGPPAEPPCFAMESSGLKVTGASIYYKHRADNNRKRKGAWRSPGTWM